MKPGSRALRGSVEKLKTRVQFLETVLKERDTANAASFTRHRTADEGLALGNEALSQVNEVAINNSRPSVSLARDMSAILDQIGSDEIFRGHLLCPLYGHGGYGQVQVHYHYPRVFRGQAFLTLFIHHTTPKCQHC